MKKSEYFNLRKELESIMGYENLRSSNEFGKIKEDFLISFKLSMKNFLPFFVILLIGTVIFYAIDISLRIAFYENLVHTIPSEYINLIYSLIKLPSDAILHGFFGCAMGLAYDIISSGDEFAQIKNSIYYIREYWLKFFLFGFIANFLTHMLRLINPVYITEETCLKLSFEKKLPEINYITNGESFSIVIKFVHLFQRKKDVNTMYLTNHFNRSFQQVNSFLTFIFFN